MDEKNRDSQMEVTFQDVNLARQLFGEHNKNLGRIADALAISLNVRGNTVYIKGDTVIKERWHNLTTTSWKTTNKTDTIVRDTYVLVTDTIKVKYYVNRYKTKEVEKPVGTWHKIRLFAGDCVLLFLAIFAVCWIKEHIKKRVQ